MVPFMVWFFWREFCRNACIFYGLKCKTTKLPPFVFCKYMHFLQFYCFAAHRRSWTDFCRTRTSSSYLLMEDDERLACHLRQSYVYRCIDVCIAASAPSCVASWLSSSSLSIYFYFLSLILIFFLAQTKLWISQTVSSLSFSHQSPFEAASL